MNRVFHRRLKASTVRLVCRVLVMSKEYLRFINHDLVHVGSDGREVEVLGKVHLLKGIEHP